MDKVERHRRWGKLSEANLTYIGILMKREIEITTVRNPRTIRIYMERGIKRKRDRKICRKLFNIRKYRDCYRKRTIDCERNERFQEICKPERLIQKEKDRKKRAKR